jgi:uncharacterized protein YprB with RNaseH-like and TPR domain
MDSLSERLKSMGVRIGARDLPRSQPQPRYTIDRVVQGRVLTTQLGETFIVEGHYPQDHHHGNAPLAVTCSLKRLFEWGRTGEMVEDISRFYFIDTETTGLAGGTGTFAFLVGVGHFSNEGFEITQFFMRDPSEEAALLLALQDHMHDCQVIVTYNGKAFDAPLLNTRYTLQGFSTPISAFGHIDLLPLARRLWRDRLPSRTLGYIETSILGAYRGQEEVPGWLIPQLYFDYLRSGDARPLAGVFYHNAMDILALTALFSHTARMLSDPSEGQVEENLDRAAIGRLYEEMGHIEEALVIYRQALEAGLPENHFWIILNRLAMIYRRSGNWGEAVSLWVKAADKGQLEACIELAKYYEHVVKDARIAITYTEKALNIIQTVNIPTYQKKQALGEIEHRRERLLKKCEG